MNKKKFIEICEKLDWSVWEGDEAFEIRKYSPAGEDFSFIIDGTGDLVEQVKEYAADFCVDEHVTMWLYAKREGIKDVPSATELVEDAKSIDQMLRELAIALQNEEDGVVSQNTSAVVTESVTITIEVNLKDDGTLNLYVSEEGSSGCEYECARDKFGYTLQSYLDTQSGLVVPVENKPKIVSAKFVSYWDCWHSRVETDCKVNLDTGEIFDIEKVTPEEFGARLDALDAEEVVIDGTAYYVFRKDEAKKGDFWYDV